MNTKRAWAVTILSISAVCLLTTAAAGQTNDRAEVALKAAMEREIVDGDLKAAIEQYRKIAALPGVSRTVAATALLRMAECHEKLGQAEARNLYARVVREYADVADLAATARLRLASMSRATTGPPSLTVRRVYGGAGVDWCVGLSSDGRFLSHPDWVTGNLAVADMRSGEVRRVTTDGSIAGAGEFAECSLFSPDDKQIVYFWSHRDGTPELRTIGFDGANARVLYRATGAKYVMPLDWTADGRRILAAVFTRDGASSFVFVSAADGTTHTVKTFSPEATGYGPVRLSPDGKTILYAKKTNPSSAKRDLFVLSADGAREFPLAESPADDAPLGWASASKVVFASDRSGSRGVWAIDVREGRPVGMPSLLKGDVGSIEPIRIVNGTLYYSVYSRVTDVYTAAIDPQSGKLASAPVLATKHYSGANAAPEWSPDGKLIAYRHGNASDALHPPPLLSILNVDTGEEREVRAGVEALDFNDGPHWSPDGRSLLAIGLQTTPDAGVHRVDLQTGATTTLAKAAPGQWLLFAAWARDGKSIFYTTGNPTRIVRHDVESGHEQDVATLDAPAGLPSFGESPDGRWLAFRSRDPNAKSIQTLCIVPTEGGPVRELHRTVDGGFIGRPVWSPDGRWIYAAEGTPVTAGQSRGPQKRFLRIGADGEGLQPVDLDIPAMSFSFNPDGRRITFSTGERKAEVWALENMLAKGSAP